MEQSNIVVHFVPSTGLPPREYTGVCEYQFTGNYVIVFHDTTKRDVFPLEIVGQIEYEYNV
jgi:hypothetical protein